MTAPLVVTLQSVATIDPDEELYRVHFLRRDPDRNVRVGVMWRPGPRRRWVASLFGEEVVRIPARWSAGDMTRIYAAAPHHGSLLKAVLAVDKLYRGAT